MDEFQRILGYSELSQEDCTAQLGRNPDADSDLPFLFVNISVLHEAAKLWQNMTEEDANCNRETLLQIAAVLYSNAVENETFDGILSLLFLNIPHVVIGKLVACKLLLSLCSLPLSSAYGVLTSNLLSSICGIVTRITINILGGLHTRKRSASSTAIATDNAEAADDFDEDGLSQQESEAHNSQRSHRGVVDTSFSDELGQMITALHQARPLFVTRCVLTDLLWPHLYTPFSPPLCLYNRTEEYVIESLAETLTAAMCLGSAKKDYAGQSGHPAPPRL